MKSNDKILILDFGSQYTQLIARRVREIGVFSAALIGAGLGFLWFNAPPAAVFMGDTG